MYICNLLKMEGISNKTIANFEKTSNEEKKNFDVFPPNYVTKFISFHSMMTESGAVNLFIIMNTDQSDKKDTYCFLDLHPKKEVFLFNSFGFQGFKEFILQDDQKILNKVLYGIEKS